MAQFIPTSSRPSQGMHLSRRCSARCAEASSSSAAAAAASPLPLRAGLGEAGAGGRDGGTAQSDQVAAHSQGRAHQAVVTPLVPSSNPAVARRASILASNLGQLHGMLASGAVTYQKSIGWLRGFRGALGVSPTDPEYVAFQLDLRMQVVLSCVRSGNLEAGAKALAAHFNSNSGVVTEYNHYLLLSNLLESVRKKEAMKVEAQINRYPESLIHDKVGAWAGSLLCASMHLHDEHEGGTDDAGPALGAQTETPRRASIRRHEPAVPRQRAGEPPWGGRCLFGSCSDKV